MSAVLRGDDIAVILVGSFETKKVASISQLLSQ
jgi:hypothetical protein